LHSAAYHKFAALLAALTVRVVSAYTSNAIYGLRAVALAGMSRSAQSVADGLSLRGTETLMHGMVGCSGCGKAETVRTHLRQEIQGGRDTLTRQKRIISFDLICT
jgi:ABC-type glutathione transport system ATPase component